MCVVYTPELVENPKTREFRPYEWLCCSRWRLRLPVGIDVVGGLNDLVTVDG
jgi:hypothetical protein